MRDFSKAEDLDVFCDDYLKLGVAGGGTGTSRRRGKSEESIFPDDTDAGRAARGHRICVIDPDDKSLNHAERILGAMGHEILGIDRIIGASNQIRRFRPDLLVVDVKMPTLSGMKLVQVLRQNLGRLPILILYSDMDESELAEVARVTAADDFVTKKESVGTLAGRVRYHLGQMRARA